MPASAPDPSLTEESIQQDPSFSDYNLENDLKSIAWSFFESHIKPQLPPLKDKPSNNSTHYRSLFEFPDPTIESLDHEMFTGYKILQLSFF